MYPLRTNKIILSEKVNFHKTDDLFSLCVLKPSLVVVQYDISSLAT